MVTVSVLITIYNAKNELKKCLDSLVNQSFSDFEIIVVEDPPFDGSKQIIDEYGDNRISYIGNTKRLGLSQSRNVAIENARGRYLFFTDSDCVVSSKWIESGVQTFQNISCVGVEGRTFYVSENYQPTFSDRIISNLDGGNYNTCNMAYSKNIIDYVHGFDSRFSYHEDRDIAFRILKQGNIIFNSDMIVYHSKSKWKAFKFIKFGNIIKNRVLLFKKFNDTYGIYHRIVFPKDLAIILFPPFLIGLYLNHKNKFVNREDWILLPLTYLQLWDERLNLWLMCIKEKVFLI